MKKEYLIGIDPGNNTGVCNYDPEEQKLRLGTLDFWGTIRHIAATIAYCKQKNYKLLVYVEDPNKNKNIFSHFTIPAKFNDSVQKKIDYVGKIAQNVGNNKAQAALIIAYLDMYKVNFRGICPKASKINGQAFQALTGIKRSNSHTRDAAMLIIRHGISTKEIRNNEKDKDYGLCR